MEGHEKVVVNVVWAFVIFVAICSVSCNHVTYLKQQTLQVGLASGADPISLKCGLDPTDGDGAELPMCTLISSKMNVPPIVPPTPVK